VPGSPDEKSPGAIIRRENDYVMKGKIKRPKKILKFFVAEEEFETINALYAKTECHTMSEYLRRVCVQKPVIIIHRNETAEDHLTHMLHLKKDLEINLKLLSSNDQLSRQVFEKKLEDLSLYMQKIYDIWSRV
jgi:hypothetical protein